MDNVVKFKRYGRDGTVLSDYDLFNISYRAVIEEFKELEQIPKVYNRVSEERNKTHIDPGLVFGSFTEHHSQIVRLNEPELMKHALEVLQNQRLIDDYAYEIVGDLNKFRPKGQQIIAILDKPLLRMVWDTPTDGHGWVANPTRVESYAGGNFFCHVPHLDTGGSFDLTLHIEDNHNRGLIETIFRNSYEHYKGKGFDLLS